ncbi:MAG: radical SAM protein [Kiritimatiellaeota bacterium]|nr:radical SAM protein [Kiritimatiellota bacterium]
METQTTISLPRTAQEIAALLREAEDPIRHRELTATATALVRRRLGTRAHLWCAIGVDYKPCSMNCRFCSLGAEWGAVTEERELDDSDVLKWARYFVENGADYIVLRTCEDFDFDRLCGLGRSLRTRIAASVRLVANTRELSFGQASLLRRAGFDGIYKTIRLREGVDTPFDREKRLRTIQTMRKAGLDVYSLVEPIGPEHTYEEIAEAMVLLRDRIKPALVGAMARVPVPATPLGRSGRISERELAKITAVAVLALLPHIDDVEIVCSHPPCRELPEAGANGLVVEVGAIPRDEHLSSDVWQRFTMDHAKKWLREAGWSM